VVVLTLCRDETWKKWAGGLESDKEDGIDGGTSAMEYKRSKCQLSPSDMIIFACEKEYNSYRTTEYA
jgi:hypothetical protein